MDSLYGISTPKVPKRSSLSTIHNFGTQNPYYHHHTGQVVDPYASPDGHNTVSKNLNSPFLSHLQYGRSHLATPTSVGQHSPSMEYTYHHKMGNNSENFGKKEPPRHSRSPLPFRNCPVNVEEDVLVMDGVLVKKKSVDKSRSSSLSLTDSGSSASSCDKNYKMDFCASYLENSDFSSYGSKFKFASGNKELRPSQISYKNILETPCKHHSVSCSHGSKCRYLHPETSTATSSTEPTPTIKQVEPTSSLKSTNWSPMDDGIMIHTATGITPTSEKFDAYMNNVVYGPRRIKRLPVFNQICSE